MTPDVLVVRKPAKHTLQELARLAAEPLRRAGAERAVAFGSYARGTADGYADLDLIVVLATDLPRLERPKLLSDLYDAIPVPLDLLVYTPEEFATGVERGRGVFAAIADEGVTIYERSAS
jgi:predicted nucleotidyltransferase